MTSEELRNLVATQAQVTPKQRLFIEGAFEISERTLHEVLRPRPDVFVLDADQPADAALAAGGFSRAPVGLGAILANVTGVVHLRDLLGHGADSVGSAAAPIFCLPEGGRGARRPP